MPQKFTKVLGIIALTGLGLASEAQTINWSPAGPIYTAGRARNMIVDKNDPTNNTMYVGSASSGIFKTTDAGSNWAPINDQASVRNISYLAQAKDGTIYVATGEGFLHWGQKAKAEPGTGLYKLTGASLDVLTPVVSSSVVGTVINRIACDPSNAQHIAIATNKGIMVSTDGSSFNLAPGIPTSSLISGMDVKFDGNGILYCSAGSELAYLQYNTVASKVYRSTDNTLTSFAEKTPTASVLTDANYGRIELAIAPTDNNVIYASCANKSTTNPTTTIFGSEASATLKAIFVSYDGGSNWGLVVQGSSQIDPLSNGGTLASGDYSHVLLVSPSDKNVLFVGGYFCFVYFRTGGTNSAPLGDWLQLGSPYAVNTPYYLHENIHDIKIVPASPNNRFYFITDAGIYRSSSISSANQTVPPSFQPFYKGLSTGQFNSVSIERFPITGIVGTAPGSSVTPYIGFVGGTGGNGFTYYSGTSSLVTQESRYLNGEVYNSEYSKILPDAAFLTTGSGNLYRTANAKNTSPAALKVNSYTGILSKIAPSSNDFLNPGFSSGTPFRLWENYGQRKIPADSIAFYNDSLRFFASMPNVATLTTQTTFTFAAPRPNRFALIDSIVIRTGTVVLPIPTGGIPPAFSGSDLKDITLKLNNNYVVNNSVTVITGSNISSTGLISTSTNPTVTLDASSLEDAVSVTFIAPPFATKTVNTLPNVPNPADFYRVYATIFYKYKAGDSVSVLDNNISTKSTKYSAVLANPLSWAYGSRPAYNITVNNNPAIPNATFVLNPGNVSQAGNTFTVQPLGPTSYTVMQYGTYTLTAPAVNYTITAPTDTAVPSPTYVLMPGNVTQTTPDFTVAPTTLTNYTITETVSGTPTYSTVGTTTYALYPDSTMQSSPVFVVSPTVNTTYTAAGISSNTLAAANTSTTYVTTVAKTTTTVGSPEVPQPKNNGLVKIPMHLSARLALVLNNSGNTGLQNAVVVAKNPLSLNDPLNLVRVSQSGCLTDDANGIPTTNTISIPGKPVLLEWSKRGTEIYYATNDNKLYRVSHITTLMDQSASNYSGKFFTDIFKYNNVAPHGVNSSSINPLSPYRTTLIGDFGSNQISSISVSSDDQKLLVTFGATSTGTAMVYNTADPRTSNISNIGWVNKTNNFPNNLITYCSLIEKDNTKQVFVGTNNGIYYTQDITSANWVNVNSLADAGSLLPNVQVFDLEQQTIDAWDCYNSGQIYVATNGRGIWVTGKFFAPYTVSVEELTADKTVNDLRVYPNPANGKVNVVFNGVDGEKAVINVIDLSGRLVQTENLGTLRPDEINYSFDVSSLNAGIYIVNISATSGVKRTVKLIVTK
jgi:hypothetical protein